MSKQKIREWLENNFLERRFGCITDNDIAEAIEKCINDLGYHQEQSGRVSVEDRLPDQGEEAYMVTDGRYVNITEYDAEDERFLEIPNCALVNITHWMPLPLPPTEEA